MKSVLFSFCLIATAVFAPATPYPIREANLECDGALGAAIPSSLNCIPSTQLAVLQADQREVDAVVVDMPQRVSLEFASPDTWGALPTFDPRAIYSLQHEVKTEGKLKFADDYHRRLVSTEGD